LLRRQVESSRKGVIVAASDGIKEYWEALVKEPRLVVFDYLAAQRAWQKYCIRRGAVHFMGKPNYIAFMQAFMMAGVKGTALISFLGELYKVGSDPSSTPRSLVKTIGKKAVRGIVEYEAQIKTLETAELGYAWVNAAVYSCGIVMDSMVQDMEISPSDLM
jgi:hypothetical protein